MTKRMYTSRTIGGPSTSSLPFGGVETTAAVADDLEVMFEDADQKGELTKRLQHVLTTAIEEMIGNRVYLTGPITLTTTDGYAKTFIGGEEFEALGVRVQGKFEVNLLIKDSSRNTFLVGMDTSKCKDQFSGIDVFINAITTNHDVREVARDIKAYVEGGEKEPVKKKLVPATSAESGSKTHYHPQWGTF